MISSAVTCGHAVALGLTPSVGGTSAVFPPARERRRARHRRGYTLLEMMIAMIMFLFITVATSFALSSALKSQQSAQRKIEESQELRSLVGFLSRDIRAAYASEANPNTFFLASGDGNSMSSLTFTALAHRISMPPVAPDGTVSPDAQTMPQSDVSVITYAFDPDSGVLSRTESAVPNPDVQPPTNTPGATLSSRVRQIQIQFLDPANPDPDNGWLDAWTYVSQAAQTAGTDLSQMATSSGQQNTTLPMTVRISLLIQSPSGIPTSYTTTIPILNPQPQPKGQTPDAPITPATGGTGGNGSGGNGNGGGGNGGGGGGGGNGGGGTGSGPRGSLPGLTGVGPRL
jgi:prepilin-type N-terminal cleavage/methylation domain-containing protein